MTRKDWGILAALVIVFLLAYFLNFSSPRIQNAVMEAFLMLQWYARNHTLACVVPAMFIAGGIATFLSKEGVLRHLGPQANKIEAYAVASVAGTVLAVCSCSVLPMFAGIYRVGAGLGPAAAFLYSGPAINVMAIFLTARVLGWDLGIARVVGAVVFAVVIGLHHGLDLPQRRNRPNQGVYGPSSIGAAQTKTLAKRGVSRRDDSLPGVFRLERPESDPRGIQP
ncbi:MAG: hypothetical protein KatS3mg112_0257 [Thermogutta sp.]|nr:MAG: hypothetical protein KatS3mg112_0257 [Thermogutta sp.]